MKKKKKKKKKKGKKTIQETKIHATRRFPAGSLAVHIGDHLRFGIICCPIWGSLPVWGLFASLYSYRYFGYFIKYINQIQLQCFRSHPSQRGALRDGFVTGRRLCSTRSLLPGASICAVPLSQPFPTKNYF